MSHKNQCSLSDNVHDTAQYSTKETIKSHLKDMYVNRKLFIIHLIWLTTYMHNKHISFEKAQKAFHLFCT